MHRKPKILIIGHAQHGKDTAADYITRQTNLKSESSSWYVAKNFIWDFWGKDKYNSILEMYIDRKSKSNRIIWFNLIAKFLEKDKTKIVRNVFDSGYSIYTGMRKRDEFEASRDLFDFIISLM